MTGNYRLTPRAYADLRNIGRYTKAEWGVKQRDIYLTAIEQRFALLADNPESGRRRDEIARGYYSFPFGEHMIFYVVKDSGIAIIGIPHQRMDIDNYFAQ